MESLSHHFLVYSIWLLHVIEEEFWIDW